MLTAEDYERAAQAYCESLPPEHFMEATPQYTQREITGESFAVLRTRIKDFQYFGELLVQAVREDGSLVQVVPDNMAILSDEPYRPRTSYALELEKAPIFWVLEWVSKNSQGKDYGDSFKKYEEDLQVPYCLMFNPDEQDLRMYRYNGEGYVRMEPDSRGRMRIDQLDLEVGLLDGWVRYWHKGELLPLPEELVRDSERLRQSLKETQDQVNQQAELLQHKDEILAEQAAELRKRDEQVRQRDEQVRQRDEQLAQLQEKQRQGLVAMQRNVEERARRAGREDILAQLPQTSDLAQLALWLGELP
jgi:Uma2 family endonuclease